MLKQDNLIKMSEVRKEWCVSIYLPFNQTDGQKSRNRLKNLMFDAEKQLLDLKVYPLKVAKILAPIEMLLDNPAFWKNNQNGFASFLTNDSFVWYSLPVQTQELAVVTDRFHLKPLLRSTAQAKSFYLLTLSQNQIKFFEGSETGLNEIILRGMPRSLDHYILMVEVNKSSRIDSRDKRTSFFHPQNGNEFNKLARITDGFRKVDKVVSEFLKNEKKPLILAGVDYLLPIYQSINSYQHLIPKVIMGNTDELSDKQLLEKALPFVNSIFQREKEKAVETFKEKLGTNLASNKLPEIFKAVNDGRIETLFVSESEQIWGLFDEKTSEMKIHEKAHPGDKDLLCVASTKTILKGGKVFVFLPEEMPNKSSIAALMRY